MSSIGEPNNKTKLKWSEKSKIEYKIVATEQLEKFRDQNIWNIKGFVLEMYPSQAAYRHLWKILAVRHANYGNNQQSIIQTSSSLWKIIVSKIMGVKERSSAIKTMMNKIIVKSNNKSKDKQHKNYSKLIPESTPIAYSILFFSTQFCLTK